MQSLGCLMIVTGSLILLSFVLPFIGIPLSIIWVVVLLLGIFGSAIQKRGKKAKKI